MPTVHENTQTTHWSPRPPSSTWDPVQAMRWSTIAGGADRFVSLGTLLQRVRQGVFSGIIETGNVAVRMLRVGDINPILLGEGELHLLSDKLVQRHIASEGDVLVSRVGRLGLASCVTNASTPLVPRDSILAAKPIDSRWGAAIAAALSSNNAYGWMADRLTGSHAASLTIDQLNKTPIPSPSQFDFDSIHRLVDQAGLLMNEARKAVSQVRGEVGIELENAPTKSLSQLTFWLEDIAALRAWSWQDVERYSVRRKARGVIRGLHYLSEAVSFADHRASTEIVERIPSFTIDANDVRSDWYLALPEQQKSVGERATDENVLKRYFSVAEEALLIPTVGDITASPVVVPQESIDGGNSPLMVPTSWLPIVGLQHPRALAVLLDHPFVQLQRRLGGAFSTVPHITKEEIQELLIPAVPTSLLDRWEGLMRVAHNQFIHSIQLTKQAIATVEEWYT